MRFKRPEIITHIGQGTYQNGEQTTAATTTQTELNHLVLGDGAASFTTHFEGGPVTVLSALLPTTGYALFEFDIADNAQVFANVHVVDFGSGGMAQLDAIIEFQDPSYPEFWVPSEEGIARSVGTRAGHTHQMSALGSYVIASRVEHRHFKKVRFGFQADGTVDGATQAWVTWYNDGAPSMLTDSQNSDTGKVWNQ